MGLMQLLTVGHSLTGVKDPPAPYRVAKQGWFPRFGFSKSSNTTDAQAANQVVTAVNTGVTGPEKPVRPKLDSPPLRPVQRTPDRKPLYARVLAFPQTPRRPALLRQAELSLDTVRVVRNDLSDTDIEIVRGRKKQTTPEKNLPPQPVPKPVAAAPAQTEEFESLANRMLKAQWLLF